MQPIRLLDHCRLTATALGLALLLWAAMGSQPAAAHTHDDTHPDTDNTVVTLGSNEGPASAMRSESGLPLPPLYKPSMGPPLILLDKDGDVQFPTSTAKWIDVDLSEQKVIAFDGLKPLRSFLISSGLPGTPTVTGTFRIRAKVRSQTMSGGNRAAGTYYNLPNVEWVQYFYQNYAFHGTYWHNNFGNPMSHGCINMTNEDAKWLFDWATPQWNGKKWQKTLPAESGTLVVVHK